MCFPLWYNLNSPWNKKEIIKELIFRDESNKNVMSNYV